MNLGCSFLSFIICAVLAICILIGDPSSSTTPVLIIAMAFFLLLSIILALSNKEINGKNGNAPANARKSPATPAADTYTQALEETKLALVKVTMQQYQGVSSVVRRGKKLCKQLDADEELNEAVCEAAKQNKNNPESGIQDLAFELESMMVSDFITIFKRMGHPVDTLVPSTNPVEVDYHQPEAQVLYAMVDAMVNEGDSYSNFRSEVFSANHPATDPITPKLRETVEQALQVYMQSRAGMRATGIDDFNLVLLTWHFGRSEYVPRIRRIYLDFAQIIASVDGEIDGEEKALITELREAIAKKSLPQVPGEDDDDEGRQAQADSRLDSDDWAAAGDAQSDPMKQLQDLVGLGQVKKQLQSLAEFLAINKKRQDSGLKVAPVSYHCVFTGNPGTGKTTVARILARIYKKLGILEKGQLVETDRSGLVAEYVGQTAVKTNKIIDKALGGVLFIDEAYTLAQGGDNDYGREAIATLLKRMEDDRDRLVVVLAGYTDEIEQFIESNPGLRSRFNRYITFDDYTESELFQIFLQQAHRYDYKLTPDAEQHLHKLLAEQIAKKQKDFGNARYVRNLFEKVIEKQAVRLSSQPDVTPDALSQITAPDIQATQA